MRNIFIFMISVLLLTSVSCEKKITNNSKNDLIKLNLYGKVKSINQTEYTTEEQNGYVSEKNRFGGDPFMNFIYFNEKGYIYKSGILDENSASTQATHFIYNENDQLIEKTTSAFLYTKHVTIYEHDKNGNITEEKNYDTYSKQCSNRLVRNYDDYGNNIEENYYEPCNILQANYILKYDNRGNVIERSSYSSEGMPESNQEILYDSNNNIIENISYLQDTEISGRTTYEYDDKGNCIKSTRYKYGGTVSFITEYKYEFDGRGNWIKQITYTGKKNSLKITERDIQYYD